MNNIEELKLMIRKYNSLLKELYMIIPKMSSVSDEIDDVRSNIHDSYLINDVCFSDVNFIEITNKISENVRKINFEIIPAINKKMKKLQEDIANSEV